MKYSIFLALMALVVAGAGDCHTAEFHPCRVTGKTMSGAWVVANSGEIAQADEKGRLIALFPCSIAADKAKLPPEGELQVTTIIPHPDYTYTPDRIARGGRIVRRLFPPGPNNPVGSSWIGLTLPGYGIHGTPKPETIGRAESHGCFRLANWNAVRLRKMCEAGTSVVVEK